MSEAERLFSDIFKMSRAFFERPEVKAYYEQEAKRNAAIRAKELLDAQARRDAEAAEVSRGKAYDHWALNGGGNECIQFGNNDGCKPHCPVFERSQCEMQAENEALFAREGSQS